MNRIAFRNFSLNVPFPWSLCHTLLSINLDYGKMRGWPPACRAVPAAHGELPVALGSCCLQQGPGQRRAGMCLARGPHQHHTLQLYWIFADFVLVLLRV